MDENGHNARMVGLIMGREKLYSAGVLTAVTEIEGERLRSIRLHEHVNALPDAHYSTLKFLMGHLYR